jgi:hypothetical protein
MLTVNLHHKVCGLIAFRCVGDDHGTPERHQLEAMPKPIPFFGINLMNILAGRAIY